MFLCNVGVSVVKCIGQVTTGSTTFSGNDFASASLFENVEKSDPTKTLVNAVLPH